MSNILDVAKLIEDEEGQIVVFPDSIQFDAEEVVLIKRNNIVVVIPVIRAQTTTLLPAEQDS